ncbi:MAG TPA: alpha/beta fold hydrolase [Candidatus Polarisedimenticolaceae bacterium]|nr:alpha/beta fold hydrolase [Candidatus Polarisedimenticolaceae bacterium]
MIDRLLDPLVRRLLRPPRRAPRALPADLADRAEDVTIGTPHPMKGWFLCADRPRGAVLIVHGWGSDAGRSSGLARSLIEAGLDVLLVDLPGHGRTGPVVSYDVVRMLEDIEASRRWLAARDGRAGRAQGLVGISFGGVGAYAAASRDRSWAALALVAAPMGPLEATALYLEARRVPKAFRGAMLGTVGRVLSAAGQDFRGPECLAKVEAPVLIVHGTEDRVVPIGHAHALASAPQAGEREVHWVPGGGHELADDPETGRRISEFFARTVISGLAL